MFVFSVLFVFLVLTKTIHFNKIFITKSSIKGVDVSHYQGEIDWNSLEKQDIKFAFIKATEGSGHVDVCFEENWKSVKKTNIIAGAYHFFSFDSQGKTQAKLFIHTVGDLSGQLLPVVDVEYYGKKEKNPPSKKRVVFELKEFLKEMEEQYHTKPMIYTTYKVYKKYIKGEFGQYPLWIRNVYYPPVGDIGKKWAFWQYCDTEVIDGYKGKESFIDLNVFRDSADELKTYILPEL